MKNRRTNQVSLRKVIFMKRGSSSGLGREQGAAVGPGTWMNRGSKSSVCLGQVRALPEHSPLFRKYRDGKGSPSCRSSTRRVLSPPFRHRLAPAPPSTAALDMPGEVGRHQLPPGLARKTSAPGGQQEGQRALSAHRP